MFILFPGAEFAPATIDARVDEGLQTDAADDAGAARGDIAVQVRDHSLRQVVGFDIVIQRQFAQSRHQPPVTADDPLYQSAMAEMIESTLVAVTLARGVDEGQAGRRGTVEKALLEADGERLGEADTDESCRRQRCPIRDFGDRLFGADQF